MILRVFDGNGTLNIAEKKGEFKAGSIRGT
jgi:hypothetical protein